MSGDASNEVLIANLRAVEHSLSSLGDFWNEFCVDSYKNANVKSPIIHESRKTLHVTLPDTNEPVTGRTQNEVFFNTLKIIGLKACHDACKANGIFAFENRRQLIVDTSPQAGTSKPGKDNGVEYHVFTGLNCQRKAELLKHIVDATGCRIHVSYE